jgi:hypothetical protein
MPTKGKAEATAGPRESEGPEARAFLPVNSDKSRETVKQLGEYWLRANKSRRAEHPSCPPRSQAWTDRAAAAAKSVWAPGGP